MRYSLNDSIAKKIFTIVGILSLALILITSIGLISLSVINRAVVLTRAERDHTVNFFEGATHFEEFMNTGNLNKFEAFKSHVEVSLKMSGIFGSVLTDLKKKTKDDIAREMAQHFPSMDYRDAKGVIGVVDLLESNSMVTSLVEIAQKGHELSSRYLELAERFKKSQDNEEKEAIHAEVEKLSEEMTVQTQLFSAGVEDLAEWAESIAKRAVLGSLIVLLVVGIVLSMLTARSIVRPLVDLVRFTKVVAQGDLSQRIETKSKDETAVLAAAFNELCDSLQGIVGQILDGTHTLASSISQISSTASQLAASASESSSSLAEITATVEEVKQTAHLSNEKSELLADDAGKASTTAESGKKATEKTIKGMDLIRKEMEDMAESIVKLSEQTQSIGEIISAVNDLADQSNLLSVNAAIEAAKAGEHGKGFSVVAQEVKSLADQSREATGQIKVILNDIVKATSKAVMATEQGSKAVEKGVALSSEAGEAITSLAGSIRLSAEASAQIAASSEQQLAGMEQLAQAMESIKEASMQNVDGAKQLETATKGLGELSQKLKETSTRFKV